MKFLSSDEVKSLTAVRDAVLRNESAEGILGIAREINVEKHKLFPVIYAGALLAGQDRIADSVKVLETAAGNVFADVLRNYMTRTGSFRPMVTVFKKASPYTAWTKTNFAVTFHEKILEAVEKFARENPPKDMKSVSIIDIGTGNGILISKIVNRILSVHDLKEIRLVLVDPSEDMLKTAVRHCSETIRTKVNFSTVCCKIQQISELQKALITGGAPYWFVNSALSIHHMPWEQKLPVLGFFRTISGNCVIEEANWNHDIPDKYSPELIYSLYQGYGGIFQDVFESGLSKEEIRGAIDDFFLTEAINIIRNDRLDRIDFHTTEEEWGKLAVEAGFNVERTSPGLVKDGEMASFVMFLSR